ncbi:MAG: caspase family protein [Pseudomonadota bacterium]
MSGLLRLTLVLMLLPAMAAMAAAQERIALVIGNERYAHVPQLDNPVADARLMAKTLATLGFEVTLQTDSNQREMKRAIAAFGRRLRSAGPDAVSLFYYAGHGVQAQGANYLVPTDADVLDEADLYLVGVEADWVLRQMASARLRTSIVILDACRDNPFAEQGLGAQGLARMNAPTGSFVAYSTAPGAVALDGAGRNSPFTAALAREMTVAGRPIEAVFRAVRAHVVDQTNGAQTPWDSSSLIDAFYFKQEEERPPTISMAEERLWSTVRESGDLVELALFLRAYPDSIYADTARRMLVERSAIPAPGQDGVEPGTPQTAQTPPAQQPQATLTPIAPAQPGPAQTPPAQTTPAQTTPAQTTPAQTTPGQPPPARSDPQRTAMADPVEDAMFEAALQAGIPEAFESFLERFPQGRHAAEAQAQLAALRGTPSPHTVPTPGHGDAKTPAADSDLADIVIAFDAPLPIGTRAIRGRTLREIVSGTPLFPPIEGLDPALWQDQPCAACHQWTQEALCTQGEFYVSAPDERIAGKRHPLGEAFLRALARWAETGCN